MLISCIAKLFGAENNNMTRSGFWKTTQLIVRETRFYSTLDRKREWVFA